MRFVLGWGTADWPLGSPSRPATRPMTVNAGVSAPAPHAEIANVPPGRKHWAISRTATEGASQKMIPKLLIAASNVPSSKVEVNISALATRTVGNSSKLLRHGALACSESCTPSLSAHRRAISGATSTATVLQPRRKASTATVPVPQATSSRVIPALSKSQQPRAGSEGSAGAKPALALGKTKSRSSGTKEPVKGSIKAS
mmetsp:Transcript_15880/g.34765  ORF Transcript_15880/g.34765 Transcript_15880/m.34765 type:complete len:200 (-) Transcript_15880:219-818(-)